MADISGSMYDFRVKNAMLVSLLGTPLWNEFGLSIICAAWGLARNGGLALVLPRFPPWPHRRNGAAA